MGILLFFLYISSTIIPLHATQTLLPPSSMHPISPPDLSWPLKVFTPPDEYLIYLVPHYTISSHFSTIGKDLSPHIRRRWEDFEIFECSHYIVYLPVDLKRDLELIRRDPDVSLVVQHAEYQAIDDPISEEFELLPKVAKRHEEL
jgi:hypothetical protein